MKNMNDRKSLGSLFTGMIPIGLTLMVTPAMAQGEPSDQRQNTFIKIIDWIVENCVKYGFQVLGGDHRPRGRLGHRQIFNAVLAAVS